MKYVFWTLIFFVLFIRIFFQTPKFSDEQKIRISSKVKSEPIRYDGSQMSYLEGLRIYLPVYPEINYGDDIVVEGKVENGNLKNAVLINKEELHGVLYKFKKKSLEFITNPFLSPIHH